MITLGKRCSLEPTDKHSEQEQDNSYISTRRGKPTIGSSQHTRSGSEMGRGRVRTALLGFWIQPFLQLTHIRTFFVSKPISPSPLTFKPV